MIKLISSFIVLVLSASFTFLYVLPAYDVSKERLADIETLSKNLSTSDEIRKLIDSTKEKLNSIDTESRYRFEVFLPEKIDTIRFANNIRNIGNGNMVNMLNIKIEAPIQDVEEEKSLGINGLIQDITGRISLDDAKLSQSEDPSMQVTSGATLLDKKYSTVKAILTFETSLEKFQPFLKDLERSLGLIDITALSFAASSETYDTKKSAMPLSPNYQFLMTVETYSLK